MNEDPDNAETPDDECVSCGSSAFPVSPEGELGYPLCVRCREIAIVELAENA